MTDDKQTKTDPSSPQEREKKQETPGSKKTATGTKKTATGAKKTSSDVESVQEREEQPSWVERLSAFGGGLTESAFRLAARTTEVPLRMGKAFLTNPDQRKLMIEAGASLRDLREVAGLTIRELGEAVDLEDQSLLEAVESGTATLSFELILRLASLLARHDPIPFIMKYTRTYNPGVWRVLDNWGFARLPLQFERERLFVNIYRGHDLARDLSDEDFAKVLQFTRSAFEMALHFVGQRLEEDEAAREEESAETKQNKDEDNDDKRKKKSKKQP